MWSLRKPSSSTVEAILQEERDASFSYPEVGATASTAPRGYARDHTRVQLGQEADVFARAREAFVEWRQFRLGWVDVPGEPPALEAGVLAPILCRAYGVWWLNLCRLVYVVDDVIETPRGRVERFGFAYGTLPRHVERGEERFLLERSLDDGAVWYDVFAFSRPRHPLARLARPLARRLQKRFARQSAAAMVFAVMEE